MKTLAVIGAGYLQRPLVEKAKAMGLRVICFAWADGAVCAGIADRFYPVSIVEKERILELCREERIDGVCTIASDVAAPTVAYVARQMSLNGNSYAAAVRANHKFSMRKAFSEAGIRCPRFAKVGDEGMPDFSGWSFPLIVKPCDRSGSLGVSLAYGQDELDKYIGQAKDLSFRREAIVEEFIEGREVSVEFISFHGNHYPLAITDKVTTGVPHFVELEHHEPADIPPGLAQEVFKTTRQALDALGLTEGASHTEYKITDRGELFIIETGGRMGGDFIGSDLVYLSTGYDFVKGVIEVALGEFHTPEFGFSRCSRVYFLSKETERLLPCFQHPGKVPGLIGCEVTDPVLKEVRCSADRSGYLIYQSDRKIVL